MFNAQASTVLAANGKPLSTQVIDDLLVSQMQKHKVPGLSFAMVSGGKRVHQAALGVIHNVNKKRVTDETAFEAASVSKPVFALLVMQLVEQGILDLDTPLSDYYDYADIHHLPEAKTITARMVLSHRTGLPNWRFFNESNELDLSFSPGTAYGYSGEGFEYLAEVVGHLLSLDHKGLDARFVESIAIPIGMTHSKFTLDESIRAIKAYAHEEGVAAKNRDLGFERYFGAAYGLHTTAIDFTPYLQELMQQSLLKKDTYAEFLKPHSVMPDDESLREDFGIHSFGLGLLIGETPYGRKYTHGGINAGFQSYFVVIPEREFGFVFFGNSDTALNIYPVIQACLFDAQCTPEE